MPQRVAIVGLGYVGLPLSVAFGRRHDVIGFDTDATRIAELREGHDRSGEISPEAIREATGLRFTTDPDARGRRQDAGPLVPSRGQPHRGR